jgi:hypothetical protein
MIWNILQVSFTVISLIRYCLFDMFPPPPPSPSPPIGGRVGEGIKQFIFVDNLRILY